jgi:hypothetical protein
LSKFLGHETSSPQVPPVIRDRILTLSSEDFQEILESSGKKKLAKVKKVDHGKKVDQGKKS